MSEFPQIATRLAALEAIRNQQHNLEEEIRRLLEFAKSLPEGEVRNQLFDRISRISALDSIRNVMKKALDSMK